MAFVHDYLTQFGGAERVLLEMHRLYPQAPIYTSIYDAEATAQQFAGIEIRTSFLQRLPSARRNFRALLPLYPAAFESLDLSDFNLVISSTTSFAKGVRTPPRTLHLSYVNTPTRFLWFPEEYAWDLTPLPARPLLAGLLPYLRRWDRAAAARPNYLIANSANVAQRIRKVYGRTSEVVHCPIQERDFVDRPQTTADYFLVVSRLLPYKRVQLAIQACNANHHQLVIIGSGPDEQRLRSFAKPNVHFAGQVPDNMRRELLARARAVIIPGIEDFGLVALEAAAAGTPVVAFAAGGSLETVVEGETGIFFREATSDDLAKALQTVRDVQFDRSRLLAHANRFHPEVFRSKFSALIDRYVQEHAGFKDVKSTL